jgi:hypothetical protein
MYFLRTRKSQARGMQKRVYITYRIEYRHRKDALQIAVLASVSALSKLYTLAWNITYRSRASIDRIFGLLCSMDGMSKTTQTHGQSSQNEAIIPVYSIIPLLNQKVDGGLVRVQNYETVAGQLNR